MVKLSWLVPRTRLELQRRSPGGPDQHGVSRSVELLDRVHGPVPKPKVHFSATGMTTAWNGLEVSPVRGSTELDWPFGTAKTPTS
jgi:hypothetical protein